MKIPLGDILRSIFKGGWIRKILDATRGRTVSIGEHDIGLNEGHGPSKPGESPFDRRPHRPSPRRPGGR
jgi:hypothetical protein